MTQYEILQFYSTWKTTNLTYQANYWLLQYPLLTVVVLRQYHKNFLSSNKSAHQQQCRRRLISLNGAADVNPKRVISQQFFKIYRRTVKHFSAAKQWFHHNRCKNRPSSKNRRIFFPHNSSPKLCVAHRLSPMQECVHAIHVTCMFENMS